MLDIDVFIERINKKSRLIGIDPGGKRIGIAISDENKIVATPYTTLVRENYADLLTKIKKIIDENQIEGIVIGNPINMDGSEGPSSQSAKDLAINFSKGIQGNLSGSFFSEVLRVNNSGFNTTFFSSGSLSLPALICSRKT